jgi:hypothetical protein
LLHRITPAWRAISERRFADSFAARALPPFDAPSLPSATAAGFFFLLIFVFDGSGMSRTLHELNGIASRFCSRNYVNDWSRLISQKTVSFSLAEPYEFALSLLAETRVALSENPSLLSNQNWWSTKWCRLLDYLQTFFEAKAS